MSRPNKIETLPQGLPGKPFYVYQHRDPVTNSVKYIGKGTKRRAFLFSKRSFDYINWYLGLKNRGLRPIVEIVEYFENEEQALTAEMRIIDAHNIRFPGELINLLNGGNSGMSGERNPMWGRKRPDLAARNRVWKGRSLEDRFGPERAAEIKEKFSKNNSGEGNWMFGLRGEDTPAFGRTGTKHPMFGKNHRPESKQKISATLAQKKGKPIIRSDGRVFSSIAECARDMGVTSQSIAACVRLGTFQVKSFSFKYLPKEKE